MQELYFKFSYITFKKSINILNIFSKITLFLQIDAKKYF